MTDELLKNILLNQIVIMGVLLCDASTNDGCRFELAQQVLHTKHTLDEVDKI